MVVGGSVVVVQLLSGSPTGGGGRGGGATELEVTSFVLELGGGGGTFVGGSGTLEEEVGTANFPLEVVHSEEDSTGCVDEVGSAFFLEEVTGVEEVGGGG